MEAESSLDKPAMFHLSADDSSSCVKLKTFKLACRVLNNGYQSIESLISVERPLMDAGRRRILNIIASILIRIHPTYMKNTIA